VIFSTAHIGLTALTTGLFAMAAAAWRLPRGHWRHMLAIGVLTAAAVFMWRISAVQDVIDQPRWLFGRTWGDETQSLRVEDRFGDSTPSKLSRMGHQVETIDGWSDIAGHAAAIKVDHDNGVLIGAADARGEGIAASW
jgi:gamma-glutamyltranspeptidase